MHLIKQWIESKKEGDRIVTQVTAGPHEVQVITYTSNGGYYVMVNGKRVAP